jgi:hypothetical protein
MLAMAFQVHAATPSEASVQMTTKGQGDDVHGGSFASV